MKKYLLLITSIVQTTFLFGQCTTTTGEECFVNITYFKCNNGFKAPIGFEWMKPTKVYFVFGNDTDNSNNYLNTITYNPYNIANGENLTAINKFYNQQQGGNSMFLGNLWSKPYDFGVKTFSLCMDCGLGYWATVQLLDGFIAGRDSRITKGSVGFPAQGFGYTCGQPTAEEALRIAYESAKKILGKTPKAFNYEIGINSTPQDLSIYDKFRSSGSSLQYQTDYDRPDKNFGYSNVPDNATEFISFVKQNKKYYYDNNTNGSKMYGCSFNEGKETNGRRLVYPIFGSNTNLSDKQSNNVQNTEVDNSQIIIAENKKLSEIINFINNNNQEKIKNEFIVLGYKYQGKDGTMDDFENFVIDYSYLEEINQEKIRIFFDISKRSEIIPMLEKLTNYKHYITKEFNEPEKLTFAFSISKFANNKSINGINDDYDVILEAAKKLYNKHSDNFQNSELVEETSNRKVNKSTEINYIVSKKPVKLLGKIENEQDYTNIFDFDKKISSAVASCGCVSVKVLENNANRIMTTFHGISNYKGPFVKNLTITFVDGTTETLTLKGELK